jgi:hypothetical protein
VIAVVCTDRGTHPEKQIGWLLAEVNDRGERDFVLVPWVPFRALKAGVDREVQRGGTLRVPRCPVCPWRDVPISQSTAARLYDQLGVAGLNKKDISYSMT